MSSDPATDRASLLALQNGDSMALNRLIDRWQRPLISYAYRYLQNSADAQDMVANVFVRLYQQRTRLRPDTNLSAWLFTTLTNLCHNHYRWQRRHPTVALDAPPLAPESSRAARGYEDIPSESAGPAQALAHDELSDVVRAAINELPHDLKMTVLLHHYQRLSYREIADIAQCSERGVETRLYRARQQLRELLGSVIREATSC